MQFNALITLLSPASNFKSKSSSETLCVGFLWRKKSLQNTFSDETLNCLFSEGKIRGFRCRLFFFPRHYVPMADWGMNCLFDWSYMYLSGRFKAKLPVGAFNSCSSPKYRNVGKENIHHFKSHIVSCKVTNRFKLAWAMLSEFSELLISVQLFCRLW